MWGDPACASFSRGGSQFCTICRGHSGRRQGVPAGCGPSPLPQHHLCLTTAEEHRLSRMHLDSSLLEQSVPNPQHCPLSSLASSPKPHLSQALDRCQQNPQILSPALPRTEPHIPHRPHIERLQGTSLPNFRFHLDREMGAHGEGM